MKEEQDSRAQTFRGFQEAQAIRHLLADISAVVFAFGGLHLSEDSSDGSPELAIVFWHPGCHQSHVAVDPECEGQKDRKFVERLGIAHAEQRPHLGVESLSILQRRKCIKLVAWLELGSWI